MTTKHHTRTIRVGCQCNPRGTTRAALALRWADIRATLRGPSGDYAADCEFLILDFLDAMQYSTADLQERLRIAQGS